MNPAILALACALLAASPVDTLPAGAGWDEVSLKCAELRDALLRSGLTGDSVRELLQDVQFEADALALAVPAGSLTRVCFTGQRGAGIGGLAGAFAGAVLAGLAISGSSEPDEWAGMNIILIPLGGLAGATLGCLGGAVAGAVGAGASARVASNALVWHRDAANLLVLRYNRLASPRRRPYPPGRLF